MIDGEDDRVFGVLRVHARGKGSGVPIDQRIFSVYTVRDGKIVRFKDYSGRAEALEAAGLPASTR